MARADLKPRHKQAAIFSRALSLCFMAMYSAYDTDQSFVSLFPDIYITMLILANDDRNNGARCSIKSLAKMTGLTRATVRKRVERLISFGIVIKNDSGLVTSPDYFNIVRPPRVSARIRKILLAATSEFRKLKLQG